MKSKFLTAAALACAISLAAPGIASAQETSVSASGTTTFCSINGVEVPCGEVNNSDRPDRPDFDVSDLDMPRGDRPDFDMSDLDTPRGDRPDFDMSDLDMPRGDRPDFDMSDLDMPRGDRPDFGRPSFDRPSFDSPTFEVPDFSLPRAERPIFEVPARPATGDSSVTVTSSSRAISNGTSTTTSTLCTMNGVEVPCGPGTSATARASFDFSLFGR